MINLGEVASSPSRSRWDWFPRRVTYVWAQSAELLSLERLRLKLRPILPKRDLWVGRQAPRSKQAEYVSKNSAFLVSVKPEQVWASMKINPNSSALANTVDPFCSPRGQSYGLGAALAVPRQPQACTAGIRICPTVPQGRHSTYSM